AALDVKNMFFMIPLCEQGKAQFAFTWRGTQYNFNRFLQGYRYSPTIAHNVLAKVLAEILIPPDVTLYRYIDDILIGGNDQESVKSTMKTIQEALTELGLEVPEAKCQGLAQEIRFLGVWWIKGAASVPPDTLDKTEHGQNPSSVKELQEILGTLGYWCKHIPGFSIIAHPLYNLLRKGKSWEWTEQRTNYYKLLIKETRLFQQLGPIHLTDP
ncbi:TF26 protein, partial [Oxyruncus cristatus]|nr:TF26 protein [Oxyruncus cristatus]